MAYCISPPSVDVESTTNGLARFRHPLEQGQGTRLVERLVQVAALRALNARWAAEQAGAAAQHPRRVLDPALEGLETALGDPDAAWVAVVDEDRRRAGLEVDVGRETADVPAVAHCPERQQRDQGMLGGVQRAEQAPRRIEVLGHPRLRNEPDRLGLEFGLREVELDEIERGLIVDRLLLIRDHLLADDDAAEGQLETEPPLRSLRLVDRGHRLLLRLRVVVARERVDERGARLEVERDDAELLAEMEVDRTLVDGRVGTLVLDQSEDRAGRAVDDGEGVHSGRAQRHP